MRHNKHECGCRSEHGRERWSELCPTHRKEFDETHARWRAEREAKETDHVPL
jgi:hypothetical protein